MTKYGVSDTDIKRALTPAANQEGLLPKESKILEAEAEIRRYQKLRRELNWLVRDTRPQNCYTTNRLAQNGCCPSERHVAAALRLLKYSCNSKAQRLTYSVSDVGSKTSRPLPAGYSDADFGGHLSRKSATGS